MTIVKELGRIIHSYTTSVHITSDYVTTISCLRGPIPEGGSERSRHSTLRLRAHLRCGIRCYPTGKEPESPRLWVQIDALHRELVSSGNLELFGCALLRYLKSRTGSVRIRGRTSAVGSRTDPERSRTPPFPGSKVDMVCYICAIRRLGAAYQAYQSEDVRDEVTWRALAAAGDSRRLRRCAASAVIRLPGAAAWRCASPLRALPCAPCVAAGKLRLPR